MSLRLLGNRLYGMAGGGPTAHPVMPPIGHPEAADFSPKQVGTCSNIARRASTAVSDAL